MPYNETLWHLQKSMWQKWESNNQFGLNDPIKSYLHMFQ